MWKCFSVFRLSESCLCEGKSLSVIILKALIRRFYNEWLPKKHINADMSIKHEYFDVYDSCLGSVLGSGYVLLGVCVCNVSKVLLLLSNTVDVARSTNAYVDKTIWISLYVSMTQHIRWNRAWMYSVYMKGKKRHKLL